MFLSHSKNFRAKYYAFLGVEGNKTQHKSNIPMALHLKHLDRGGSGFHWVGNIGIRRCTLHCWDPTPWGWIRTSQEASLGEGQKSLQEMRQNSGAGWRGWVFSQEMAVKDNRLSASGAQGTGSWGGSRAAPQAVLPPSPVAPCFQEQSFILSVSASSKGEELSLLHFHIAGKW